MVSLAPHKAAQVTVTFGTFVRQTTTIQYAMTLVVSCITVF